MAVTYSAAVRETWRHHNLDSAAHDYTNLIRYATLAASSHNTQPWKFGLERGRITVFPDVSRRCPAVDPDDHHLYASLGCATENLLLAAQAAGLRGHASYDALRSNIQIDFEKASPSPTALFAAIPQRQCSRAQYDGAEIPVAQLGLLEQAARGADASLMLLTTDKQKEQIAEYVAQGNTMQFADQAWAEELRAWIRFNAREAVGTRDGLYGPVMGSPDAPRWLGMLFMRLAFSSRQQNRKDIAHIRSSSAIAVIFSEANDRAHWIEAGRCYERIALQAAALDLRTAFINQPVEVPTLRAQLASVLSIGDRRPDLIVRLGRGPETPRSLRRPIEHVIL